MRFLKLATLLVCLCGCGHDWVDIGSSASRDTAPAVADVPELSNDEASFAFDLYRAQVGADATSNVFYSPYSVTVALAMTYAGAAGNTADQIAAAMHFTLPPDRLHEALDALDLALASRSGVQLRTANSIWAQQSLGFAQPFLDTLAIDYGSEVRGVDFVSHATQATAAIDGWVADQTSGKIASLFAPGSLGPDTRVVLADAIYFDADWQTKFDAGKTAPSAFTRLDGGVVSASMMSLAGLDVPVANAPTYAAIEIPYAGSQTSMLVVVPNGGQFASVEASLGGDFLAEVEASLSVQPGVSLSLPKFELHGASISLKSALTTLGMLDAFDSEKADFTAMVPAGGLYVTDVVHQAYVRVDENGTEAAAATGVSVGTTSIVEGPSVVVNRPFFFFIRDVPTGALLFVGRVMDPTL